MKPTTLKFIRTSHVLLAGALLVSASACDAQGVGTQGVGTVTQPRAMRQTATDARAILVKGVTEIDAPGLPGVVSVFGPRAFPVVLGTAGNGKNATVAPVVAAAQTDNGRIVAFGHDGYLMEKSWDVGQTRQLLLNAVRWTRNGKGDVGVLAGDANGDLVQLLKRNGVPAVALKNGANLDEFSALVVNGHRLNKSDEAPLNKFVARGGGLVMATTGWGWNYNKSELSLADDYFGNRLLAPAGLVWSQGTASGAKKNGQSTIQVGEVPALANAASALDLLEKSRQNPDAMSETEARLASRSLSDLLTGVPSDDAVMQKRFNALLNEGGPLQYPTEKEPLGPQQASARLRYMLALRQSQRLPIDKIRADPAAATFPGAVPASALPVDKTVAVDLKVPQWHSTGLYAAPGARVTVKLPAGDVAKKLSVRIGCHTDSLVGLDSWKRAPEISRAWPLKTATTEVANPFGGLVYVVVPDGLQGTTNVTIEGAVATPYFKLGETSVAEWQQTIRNAPGPWAEIATDRVVISVPSVNVRDINDPTPTLELYNRAFEQMADLRGIERLHPYPERIVADEQISAGYMHSGYPVMTWLDVQKKSVDFDLLNSESWGHWHEFGHNHQVRAWTPGGTGEVTNNLFALYVWENVMNKPDAEAHKALTPASFKKSWEKYDANGRKFSDLQSDPFLMLHSYLQLKNAFGWEPFKTVFRQYEAMPEAQHPQTDAERRDQWMIRFSRAVGRDLGPFYAAWGVPISASARRQVKDLPVWMPTTQQTLGVTTDLADGVK